GDGKRRELAVAALGDLTDLRATGPLLELFSNTCSQEELGVAYQTALVLTNWADPRAVGPLAAAVEQFQRHNLIPCLQAILQRAAAGAAEADLRRVAALPDSLGYSTEYSQWRATWGDYGHPDDVQVEHHTADCRWVKSLAGQELRRRGYT